MIDLKELKNIADTALSDLTVSEELKKKTLKGLHRKVRPWPKTILMPAACAAALIVVVSSGVFYFGEKQASQTGMGNTGITTLADTDNKSGAVAPNSTFSPGAQVLESWKVETMEDAKKYMGGAVLTPSYIPESSTLKEIIAAGPTTGNAISIMMEFELQGRPFTITQDKGVTKKINPENSKELDINGMQGFVNSTKFDNADTTIYSTTIRWYKDDFMYAVQGSISEEEAIKVAQSLK